MYDDMPKYMRKYLQNYGWHFNKALCNYAISLMTKNGKKLEPLTKEYIDKVLNNYDLRYEQFTNNPHSKIELQLGEMLEDALLKRNYTLKK